MERDDVSGKGIRRGCGGGRRGRREPALESQRPVRPRSEMLLPEFDELGFRSVRRFKSGP